MAQNNAGAGSTKRPVTVADSIRMTRLGDSLYTNGGPSTGIVAKFSPDGKQFVVILKKGNLEANANEYSLALFHTAEVFQSPTPRVLVSLASSSNRPAIDNVHWLDDNDTILFLGEHPGEQTQLYSLKCSSNELKRLTSSTTSLTAFAITAGGDEIVYTAQSPSSTFLTESVARKGIVVTNEWVTDLIRGSYGGTELDDQSLFIKRLGLSTETKIMTQGRVSGISPPELSLSPDGAYLLLRTEATHVSAAWSGYEDKNLKIFTLHPAPNGNHTTIFQYELVDTVTGISRVLVDAPIPWFGSEIAWSPDSKSVVVSNAYLPLNIDDAAERDLRKGHTFLVEFKIPSFRFVKISQQDLKVVSWDPKTTNLTCDIGRLDSLQGKTTAKAYFRKSGETWSSVSAPEQTKAMRLPNIVLDEDMNTPPHIVAIDPRTGQKFELMDLNPQFQELALARVEEVTWKASHGVSVKAGLYWPPNYVAGKKYPLIIQTHAWDRERFWMDGPWSTAFAAQPLAGKGFFVLQVPDPDWRIWMTSEESPRAMALYESAIDYLEKRGLIDRDRIGIIGFSRTYWYVTYTLTHSKRHFTAADITDGVDYSYFQYMAFSNAFPGLVGEYEEMFGSPPFGRGLSRWRKRSPAFLMDRIETPVRIQTLNPKSLLFDWHWYSGLSRLRKPVEMIYIPGGTHILEKPWERMTSQQGDVDWFCFWLKGEEDTDPSKVEQFKRWRELRTLMNRTGSPLDAR
jgi:dipeptidyl aminopeptidase/acylaminoacyl peptidase